MPAVTPVTKPVSVKLITPVDELYVIPVPPLTELLALAVVKYWFEPSDKSPVSDAAKLVANLLSALASALALVKYKLLEPSDKSSVSWLAILAIVDGVV